jgi:hypothetical protein
MWKSRRIKNGTIPQTINSTLHVLVSNAGRRVGKQTDPPQLKRGQCIFNVSLISKN